jgi:preprotein translocase subunit SecE
MLFVWGFGGTTHPSKKTFCQAGLIILAISLALSILFGVIAVAFGLATHPHTS